MVRLPDELYAAADRERGSRPWSEWLRGLVEREVLRRRPSPGTLAELSRHGIDWSDLDGVDAESVLRVLAVALEGRDYRARLDAAVTVATALVGEERAMTWLRGLGEP